MRLLLDMNLTSRWVTFFQKAGYEVAHWSSVGRVSAKDGEVCDYARQHSYVLLTNDLVFLGYLRTPSKLLPVSSSCGANHSYQKHAGLRSSARCRIVRRNSNWAPS